MLFAEHAMLVLWLKRAKSQDHVEALDEMVCSRGVDQNRQRKMIGSCVLPCFSLPISGHRWLHCHIDEPVKRLINVASQDIVEFIKCVAKYGSELILQK